MRVLTSFIGITFGADVINVNELPATFLTDSMNDIDQRVRIAAFKWLEKQVSVHGDVLPRSILAQGFEFEGQRVPLVAPQGIFKPKLLPQIPLSITTTPEGPYDDSFGSDGLLLYRYRGTDPQHRDNAGLRMALFRRVPLIYFHGVVPGRYLAVWPVFIVGDDPESLTFKVEVEDSSYVEPDWKSGVPQATLWLIRLLKDEGPI